VISRQPLRCALAFIALAAHNAEEALFARHWVLAHVEVVSRFTGRDRIEFWAGPDFRISLLVLTIVSLLLAILAARARQGGFAIYLLLGLLAAFVANAIFPHILGAIALGSYVPGVVTAILLVIPIAVWVYIGTLREGYATRRGAIAAAAGGIVFYATAIRLAA
jgi:hypothetical protein